jgi:mono/diheme cytochrome c family protein
VALLPAAGVQGQQQQRVDTTEGRTLYRAHCAVCHGAEAKGGGTDGEVPQIETNGSDVADGTQ